MRLDLKYRGIVTERVHDEQHRGPATIVVCDLFSLLAAVGVRCISADKDDNGRLYWKTRQMYLRHLTR